MVALVQQARGIVDLAGGRHARRLRAASACLRPDRYRLPPVHPLLAVREARALVVELERVAADTGFPYLQAALAYSRPLLAEDDARAAALFLRCWLRRRRRVADSRVPLRAAREAFDALGAGPWGERARQELRASGIASRRRIPETRDQLTPQELQIAGLAAEGLSNREIGQQLYISHRTVAYHLRRIFPKLGVTSRSQLHAAVLGMTEATG